MASTAPRSSPLYAPVDLAFHRSHTAHSLDGLDGGEDHADCAATCVSRSQPERRRGWLGRMEGGRRVGESGVGNALITTMPMLSLLRFSSLRPGIFSILPLPPSQKFRSTYLLASGPIQACQ